jgi:hypothetical protein
MTDSNVLVRLISSYNEDMFHLPMMPEAPLDISINCPLCSNAVLFNDYSAHLIHQHPITYQFLLYFSLPEDAYYDTDEMSYEELLDLCQRIGNHTIGLTESQKDSVVIPYIPTPDETATPPRCTICLTECKENTDTIRLQKCGHVHCKECIYEWLTRHKTCPVCIQEVL